MFFIAGSLRNLKIFIKPVGAMPTDCHLTLRLCDAKNRCCSHTFPGGVTPTMDLPTEHASHKLVFTCQSVFEGKIMAELRVTGTMAVTVNWFDLSFGDLIDKLSCTGKWLNQNSGAHRSVCFFKIKL